ncbi:AMP-binding protein [Paenibacillus thalictri]|uniref:2-acyl-glycerophospho-ethanolamine acyltransferase n=1 Tax=Paenibacillus thalictri TaxID=2527873 RepID=A0A4Q9DTV6_9BACL|nr:AMP-binding protein [Paenibacillus thalictri]TBL78647.1 2-acyl-glycerophospho-ethanolamine acyltransferase [Paenibacillus thalictri]
MPLITALLRMFVRICFRPKVAGLEKLDLTQPAIVMPNHVSLLDAVILALYLPKDVTFVVNTDIAKRFGLLIRLRKHITVDPLNPYSVRRMVKVVQQGTPLLLFPEGRITTTGGMMKIYPGIGYIALKTGAALYPAAINGLERSKLSYLAGKVKQVWFPKVSVSIGDPFKIEFRKDEPLRRQKERAARLIQISLQEQLFRSRAKTGVNLFNELLDAVKTNGASVQICEDITQKATYRQLLIAAYALSRKLSGLLAGQQTAAVLLPNSIGHIAALLSLFRLGVSPAILNFSAGRQALMDACETADVRTVLTSRLFVEKAKLQPVIDSLQEGRTIVYLEDIRAAVASGDKLGALVDYILKKRALHEDGEVILFTSGSENKPKGVVLGHDNLLANALQARSVIDFTQKDKMFNAMPMFHSFGLTAGTLLPLLTGMKVYLYPSPLHYKVIPELVYDKNATILLGTSTFLAAYGKTAHPYDFYSLRLVVAGAEKLKDEVRQLWADKFGLRILEGYGTTEAAPVLSLNTPLQCRKGTVGKLLPGVEYRIEPVPGIEGGNLFVKGPNLMRGYLIHSAGFVPCPEWYDCGDVVEMDDEGYLTIKSRLKRFAKIGGEMVSLNLVEEVSTLCFKDAAVAAVNIPDPRKGEQVVLFYTGPVCQLAALKEYLKAGGYPPLLAPSRMVQTERLPLLGSGKTDYVSLKKIAQEEADRTSKSSPEEEGAHAV